MTPVDSLKPNVDDVWRNCSPRLCFPKKVSQFSTNMISRRLHWLKAPEWRNRFVKMAPYCSYLKGGGAKLNEELAKLLKR